MLLPRWIIGLLDSLGENTTLKPPRIFSIMIILSLLAGMLIPVPARADENHTLADYAEKDSQWVATATLTAADGAANDDFGWSVSVSGGTMVVGASGDNGEKGSAYIFERDQGGAGIWGQVKKLTAADGAADDKFGHSVAVSGDTVVVGAPGDDGSQGAAYVFQRDQGGAGNWGQVKKLTASDGAAHNDFGGSVSVSGDTIVVGAFGNDSWKGAAYVFERDQGGAGNWGQMKKLTAADGNSGEVFGWSVVTSGNRVVAGAPGGNGGKGSAYIFEQNQGGAGNWGQTKKLTASDGAVDDFFGIAVAASGDRVAVGASQDDDKGSVYIFEQDQGGAANWGQTKKLTASDREKYDYFAGDVSLSGDTIVVGAYGDNARTGSVYIFEKREIGEEEVDETKKSFNVGAAGGTYKFGRVMVTIPANAANTACQMVVEESTSGSFKLGDQVYEIKLYCNGQIVTQFKNNKTAQVCIKPKDGSTAGKQIFREPTGSSGFGPLPNSSSAPAGYVCGDTPGTSLFALGELQLPDTGFPLGVVTALEDQPAEKVYFDLFDVTARSAWPEARLWRCDEAVSSAEVGDCFANARNDSLVLKIPTLDLELPIVGVPLTAEGWDVTWLGDQAGYLEGTAYPTWAGNTAITAHVWDADNTPGSFVDLHTLKHGDQIIIHAWGQRYVYEVRTLTKVSPEDLSVLPHSEYDVLTLITCQGFDDTSGEYDWRLAVRTVLIDVE